MSLDGINVVDYFVKLERRVARLERTSSAANSSTDIVFVGLLDVTGLNVVTQTVVAYGTDYQVYVKLGWSPVDLGSDTITDDPVKGYYTSWTKDGVNWTAEAFTDDTEAVIGPMAQGQVITFRVRCVTQKDTFGAYATIGLTTSLDNVAPLQTSTPVAIPYLGQVRLFWDGKDVSNAAMSGDTVAVQIHMSTTGITFTPTPATLVDVFYTGGGYYTITGLTYGTTYYFRLVAVDKVGNLSPVSTGASVVPVQAADGDIANLSIGKLTVGSLSADMTVSARIKTANTGARTEMNTAGFEAYNSSNIRTFYVEASTGNVTATGTFQTGLSGNRVEMTASGGVGTIYFRPSTGSDFGYLNSPLSGQLAINSGNAGGGFFTRVFVRPTEVSMGYLTTAQVEAGGTMYLTDTGIELLGVAGNEIIGSITSGAQFAVNNSNSFLQNQAGSYVSLSGQNAYLHATTSGEVIIDTGGSEPYIWLRTSDSSIDIQGRDRTWILGTTVELGTGTGGEHVKSLTIYNNTSTFTANVGIATAPVGTLWRITSSAKYKVDIKPLDISLDEIMQLVPVTYYDRRQYDDNNGDYSKLSQQTGFIAEQVATLPNVGRLLVEKDEAGLPESVNYDRAVGLLFMVVRDLVSRVATLEGKEVKLVDLNVPQEILDMSEDFRWPVTQDAPLVREERDPTWNSNKERTRSLRV